MDEEKREEVQDIQPEAVEPQVHEENTDEDKSLGPVLGSIIVVIILVVAAFYVWGSGSNSNNAPADVPQADTTIPATDAATEALAEQGTSDDIAAIEADLEATILDGLDAELEQIEAELQ